MVTEQVFVTVRAWQIPCNPGLSGFGGRGGPGYAGAATGLGPVPAQRVVTPAQENDPHGSSHRPR